MEEKKTKKQERPKTEISEKEKALIEENEKLIKETEELKQQVEEFKDKWMRNVAEFDNYKKRNAKVWQDAFNEGIDNAVMKILPIGDSLDRAIAMGLDEKTAEGIKGLIKKFSDALKTMEIEEINPIGKPFNPNEAEAIMQVEGSEGEESETVKQVFEKGYKLKDKVIRYAKVSVVK